MTTEEHFETRAERRARKRLERKQGRPSRSWWRRWYIMAGVVVVGGAVTIPLIFHSSRATTTKASSNRADLALVDSCTTDMATKFHIHAHLSIVIDGKAQDIPANTGLAAHCLHPLHTHDSTGVIHIESPSAKDFTLGDFFHVWKNTFSTQAVLDTKIDAAHQLTVFDNGTLVASGPDTTMRDRHSYAIVVGQGAEKITPPQNYDFPKNL
ncbi:MAG: hypothetical protein HY092_00360 [Candidatus Kerfeldbacteria bacterium]|nr:hypothetical protein [Candidatus Kerfeldbacteria bacterium]